MKRIIILLLFLVGLTAKGQQTSVFENYILDRTSISPSYVGNYNPGFLTIGYRSDWSGIAGGPKTLRAAYNNSFMEKAGYGASLVYDKAGIFRDISFVTSYSYRLDIGAEHKVAFGLSAGLFSVGVDLTDYYNDPGYTIDPALLNEDLRSRVKFTSGFSVLWMWNGLETGVAFSNVSFGNANFGSGDVIFDPKAVYSFHSLYTWAIDETWSLVPVVMVRGSSGFDPQLDISTSAIYNNMLFGSLTYRSPGIMGAGLGAFLNNNLRLSYNFNFASNVALNAFNNHEVTLGVNMFNIFK